MTRLTADPRDRLKSAIAVGLIHIVLGFALLRGLGVTPESVAEEVGQLVDVTLETPPAQPPLPEATNSDTKKPKDPEGAAAPPNKRDSPTEVVAPEPVLVLPPPPVLPAAKVAGEGSAPRAGAAVLPGPGTGAGGIGNGLGSGLYGNGTGGGGGGGRVSHASYLSGGIDPEDYPRAAYRRRAEGTTYVRFTVMPNGRVRQCFVTRSSGNRDLDAATCPLLERRLRYRPARNTAGRPIPEAVTGQQDWMLGPQPADRWVEPTIPDDQ